MDTILTSIYNDVITSANHHLSESEISFLSYPFNRTNVASQTVQSDSESGFPTIRMGGINNATDFYPSNVETMLPFGFKADFVS